MASGVHTQDTLSLLTALIETFLFAGVLAGWPSLQFVYTEEGYFSDGCSHDEEGTHVTAASNISTLPILTMSVAAKNATERTATNSTIATSRAMFIKTYGLSSCDAQEEQFNLVYTLTSAIVTMSAILSGYILDKFGTWAAKSVGISAICVGLILIIISSPQASRMLFIAMPLYVTGGDYMFTTNIQVANLFPKARNSIISLISAAYFSSSVIFLLIKTAYVNGVNVRVSASFLLGCTLMSWFRTFFLMPRKVLKFPIRKRQKYGLIDEVIRNKQRDSDVQKEVSELISNSEPKNTSTDTADAERSFVVCLKDSIFWTSLLQLVILSFRYNFYFSTFNSYIMRLAGSDRLDYFTNVFGAITFGGVLVSPLNGLITDYARNWFRNHGTSKDLSSHKAVLTSTVMTITIALIMSISAAIPALPLQYFTFVAVVFVRAFVVTDALIFLTTMFPGEHFGKLLGIQLLVLGCVSFSQFPIFTVVLSTFNGDFTIVNIIFAVLCFLTYIHPINFIRVIIKKGRKTQNSNLH